MISLYIDTHYNQVILALFENNKLLDKIESDLVFKQSQIVLPNIEILLKRNNLLPAQVNEIIVVNGPGSFTGVRIGVTIAKVMAYALNIPIKEISSLWIKAVQIDGLKTVGVSEKNGVFIASYDESNTLVGEPYYLSNDDYHKDDKGVILEVVFDYDKIYLATKGIAPTNSHAVKPTYVKKIEALND